MNTQEQIIFNTANRLLAGTKTAAICIDLSDGKSAYLGDDAGVMRMLQNKDQSDAAVRGEAVAESNAVFKFIPTMTRKDEDKAAHGICPACKVMGLKLINTAHGMSFFQCNNCRDITVLASARAADAPSEPSRLTEIQLDSILEKWNRESNSRRVLCRLVEAAVLRSFKSRAADALDSQPTEIANCEEVGSESTKPVAKVYVDGNGKAGVVWLRGFKPQPGMGLCVAPYQSQPTELSQADLSVLRDCAVWFDEHEKSMVSGRPFPWNPLQCNDLRWKVQKIINASSQPTDDRCAECGLHCKAGACIYGKPTDGGVLNGSEPSRDDEDWFFSPNDGN